MALTGVHITWGHSAGPSSVPVNSAGNPGLPFEATASETMASAATSTTVAPIASTSRPLLSISASAPIFYATGTTPDASGAGYPRRYFDPSLGREDIFVNPGDKFAWMFA